MRHLYLIIVFSFCIVGCQKCKKDTPVPKQYSNAGAPNQSMLDYGVFKPGTYWVYQDSTSGRLDSVWVYHYEETYDTIQKDTDHPRICKVYLYKTFSSKYRSNNYFSYNTSFDFTTSRPRLYEEVIDSTGYIGELIVAEIPFITGNTLSIDGIDKAENKYQSYTMKNQNVVNDALKFSHTKDYSSYYFQNYLSYSNKTNQYLAPHLGLIRKEVPDSNTFWNLIRYRIVQ